MHDGSTTEVGSYWRLYNPCWAAALSLGWIAIFVDIVKPYLFVYLTRKNVIPKQLSEMTDPGLKKERHMMLIVIALGEIVIASLGHYESVGVTDDQCENDPPPRNDDDVTFDRYSVCGLIALTAGLLKVAYFEFEPEDKSTSRTHALARTEDPNKGVTWELLHAPLVGCLVVIGAVLETAGTAKYKIIKISQTLVAEAIGLALLMMMLIESMHHDPRHAEALKYRFVFRIFMILLIWSVPWLKDGIDPKCLADPYDNSGGGGGGHRLLEFYSYGSSSSSSSNGDDDDGECNCGINNVEDPASSDPCTTDRCCEAMYRNSSKEDGNMCKEGSIKGCFYATGWSDESWGFLVVINLFLVVAVTVHFYALKYVLKKKDRLESEMREESWVEEERERSRSVQRVGSISDCQPGGEHLGGERGIYGNGIVNRNASGSGASASSRCNDDDDNDDDNNNSNAVLEDDDNDDDDRDIDEV
jgi:hypothetical protein